MKKRILVILLIVLIIVSSTPFYPMSVKAVEANHGYYGYLSRAIVTNALVSHTEIPDWKRAALINKLSTDHYFWFDTKQKKLNYIHQNLTNNKYLSIVADAENIHSWTVNSAGTSEVSAALSKQSYSALMKEANQNYQEWFGWANYFGTWDNFANHKKWAQWRLDVLYGKYWPDLKSQSNPDFFTGKEIGRLLKIWRLMEPKLTLPVKDIGITGEDPIWDALMFVPVERLVAIFGKAGLKAISVGSKQVASATVVGGSRVLERIAFRIPDHIITVGSRYIGKVPLNLSRMFGESIFWKFEREEIATTLTRTVSRIKTSRIFGKHMTEKQANKILHNTYVVPAEDGLGKKLEWWGLTSGDKNTFQFLKINQEAIFRSGDLMANQTMAHEVFHALCQAKGLGKYVIKRADGSVYGPLEEGFTEALSQVYMKENFGTAITLGAYSKETELAFEWIRMLDRKAPGQGVSLAAEAYANHGMDVVLNSASWGKQGLFDEINSLALKGRFREATNILRGL